MRTLELTHPTGRSGRSARGQIVPLFALLLIAMLGVAGLVVDVGGSWGQERTQQKVADTAALAGATTVANGALRAEIIQAATDSAVANGYLASEVTINIPPTQGAYAPGGSQSGALSTNDCSTGEREAGLTEQRLQTETGLAIGGMTWRSLTIAAN